jgi:hypothetical protein
MTKKPNGKSMSSVFAILRQRLTFRSFGIRFIGMLVFIAFFSVFLLGVKPLKSEAAITYLFDRTVKWADGTIERVQIGSDGIFRLNGTARRLLGMDTGASGFSDSYYSSSSLALMEKEVTYLQSKGVRTMQVLLPYEGSYGMESARYKPVLDILYKHKMLVMPLFTLKYTSYFRNLSTPNIQLSGDSLTKLVARWCAVVRSYQNVVAIYVENELDYRVNGQTYGASQAGAYMKLLTGLFRQNTTLPLATKLVGYFPGGTMDQIKQAVLPYVNIPAFDIYQYDATKVGKMVDSIKSWLSARGYSSTKWWSAEFNAVNASNGTTSSRLTSTFLDAAFTRGVPVVHLWVAHRAKQLSAAFFDAYGKPISALVNLAPNISRFQAAISSP